MLGSFKRDFGRVSQYTHSIFSTCFFLCVQVLDMYMYACHMWYPAPDRGMLSVVHTADCLYTKHSACTSVRDIGKIEINKRAHRAVQSR